MLIIGRARLRDFCGVRNILPGRRAVRVHSATVSRRCSSAATSPYIVQMTTPSGNGSILLINGPNLNLLGTREPEKYGFTTLADVEKSGKELCARLGYDFEGYQSNHEGAIVDRIHAARADGTRGIVINAGAYTHTSVAIRDALSGIKVPFVEVHVSESPTTLSTHFGCHRLTLRTLPKPHQISNVHAREPFRHHSYLSDIATGVIVGLGTYGYTAAYLFLADKFQKETPSAK